MQPTVRDCAGGFRRLGFTLVLACFLCATGAFAQEGGTVHFDTVPILSGSGALESFVNGGDTVLKPAVVPVLLVPIGDKWLVESRVEFEGEFERQPDGSFGGPVNTEIQYAQLDYIANKWLTVSAGRYLTPFGIYNERLYPLWVRNLQTEPLIFPLGTGSSTGAMLRGGFNVSRAVELNYAVYFSALSTIGKLESDRLAGARMGFFFPKYRFEIGASGQHLLMEGHTNAYGMHMAWQPYRVPLDVRGEYAYGVQGKGYWIEGAYKLTGLPVAQGVARHTQIVGRMQQFFLGKDISENDEYEMPTTRTNQVEWGVNYYFRDDFRIQTSYGRSFSADGNHNIWTAGVSYRFAFPLPLGGVR